MAESGPVERSFRDIIAVFLVGKTYLSPLGLSRRIIYPTGVTHYSNAFVDETVDVYTSRATVESDIGSFLFKTADKWLIFAASRTASLVCLTR